MLDIFIFLQLLGWLLYAGPMIAFTLLIFHDRTITRAFQKWGVGFGLSLALFIYSSVGIQYISEGHFYPELQNKPWMIAAFIMWVSNVKLEVWTLDPLRKQHEKSEQEIMQAHKNLRWHLLVHCIFIVSVHLLARGSFSS